MTIGERAYKAISDRADQKGVGIVEYAKSIGISQPNLSHWKSARSEPRAYLLSLMAEAGLDVHWILTGQEDSKVDVVRCKDCKHSYKSSGSTTGYRCCRWGIYDEDCDCDSNGFCHKGERMSDNATD